MADPMVDMKQPFHPKSLESHSRTSYPEEDVTDFTIHGVSLTALNAWS